MMVRDFSSARYRIVFGYGVGGAERDWHCDVAAFEDALSQATSLVAVSDLFQKGLIDLGNLSMKSLRQAKRSKSRDLSSYAQLWGGAEEVGLYVFDRLSATEAPSFFANLHLSRSGRFGGIPLTGTAGTPVRWFAVLAIELSAARTDATAVDAVFNRFFMTRGGMKGGILESRPYVWRNHGGLEWMYREMSQSVDAGDLSSWRVTADRELSPVARS